MTVSVATQELALSAVPSVVSINCEHCGALLPSDAVVSEQGKRFCCAGCCTVYEAVQSAGLGAFYENREFDGVAARPARPSGRRFAHLDDASFARGFEVHADGTLSVALQIEGVHCAACVWLIENLPRAARGVQNARFDFGRSIARLRWDPREIRLSEAAAALDRLGYTPHALSSAGNVGNGDRSLLMRLGVAGAIAGNVMLMALALYSGALSGMDAEYAQFFRWGSLLLSLPAVTYCASVFFRGAWASVRTRTPNMDLPIAIGISAGFALGAFNTWTSRGEIYFDTITTLIFLLLVGRWLGQRQMRHAAVAADFALALAPCTARVVTPTRKYEARADAVANGELVEVLPGERVPVDGRIESGESAIDARLLTGESAPVDVKPGDRVYAGTENISARICVRAERSGRETRLGQLIAAMERAAGERAPIVRAADRIAGFFVIATLALAVITLLIWWQRGPSLAINHAVALLVVTCPCALGMATPLAISVALTRAARRGILVKGGEVLEALARPARIIFDKSGTLTRGSPELLAWEGTREAMLRASAAEADSDHPLARALRRAFPPPGDMEVSWVERLTGAGVRAVVDGRELLVGSLDLFDRSNIELSAAIRERVLTSASAGLTPVLVAEDGQLRGLAAFGDALRNDADSTLESLARMGYSMTVLSGDHPLVVERTCAALPVAEFRGGASPEQKLAEVSRIVERGERVIVVGDGVNDAAAMAKATVGFAVHGGAEASLLAASVFATEPGVRPVLEALCGARQTLSTIHRGLAFSLAYNIVGVVLAMSGVLSPLIAAVMMPLSSLTVLTSALYSRAFRERKATLRRT
jgi:Cu2+-exporting ATPase